MSDAEGSERLASHFRWPRRDASGPPCSFWEGGDDALEDGLLQEIDGAKRKLSEAREETEREALATKIEQLERFFSEFKRYGNRWLF